MSPKNAVGFPSRTEIKVTHSRFILFLMLGELYPFQLSLLNFGSFHAVKIENIQLEALYTGND